MPMLIDGVEITSVGVDNFTEGEAQNYLDYVRGQVTTPLKSIQVKMCDDGKVDVSYLAKGEKFERIRRITGK